MSDVTRILNSIERGKPAAAAQLLPLVYDELRKLASSKLFREKPGQTLQATALVHEAYLRLIGQEDDFKWESRGHFFAAAANAMRRILIDRARRKARKVHGGDRKRQPLDADIASFPEDDPDILALDAALTRFAEREPVKSKLVELRFFAGLTGDEAAKVLGVSPRTADRYWVYARAWIRSEMDRGRDESKNFEI